MLRRRKRRTRHRIWRDFVQSMATFTALATLLVLGSGSVWTMSTSATEAKTDDASVSTPGGDSEIPERILKYESNSATPAFGIPRRNRVLQFMDIHLSAKEASESTEVIGLPASTSRSLLIRHIRSDTNDLGSDQRRSSSSKSDLSIEKYSTNSASRSDKLIVEPNRTPPSSQSAEGSKTSASGQSHHNSGHTMQPVRHSPVARNETTGEEAVKRLPKVIIIGVKKAGTRALLEFLRLHPQVEGTGPEPHFFDRNYQKGLDWYRELMPKTFKHQVTVEKTPGYFVTKDAPRRIFEMDPTIKLILVVRDPVTRAISDYCQAMAKHSMKSFEQMALLDQRVGLVNTSWGAIRIGVYAKHMEPWLQVFPLSQIHLVDGQMLVEEPARELARVEHFLGLPSFIQDSHFYLRGFKGTFPCLVRDGKPHCLDEKSKGRAHPVVKDSVLQRLRDFYRPFNAKFFQMIGRTFDWS